jgi:uncharacterized protein YdhG (YjbR/CyaY superfamily)
MAAASTIDEYLAALPEDRRRTLTAVRDVINTNLPAGYEEALQYGLILWNVPLSRYPDTYNKEPLCLVGLASQKHHMALYLMQVYGDPKLNAWFKKAYADAGKKLDMGKSCVRFKTLDAVPLDVIGELITKVSVDQYVAAAESVRSKKKAKKKTAKKQPAAKKKPAKKLAKKKPANKKPKR